MRTPPSCRCAEAFTVEQAKSHEYKRVKQILNRGTHPAFIGRMTFASAARNGGVLIFLFETEDVAVAMINPRMNVLLVLNVVPAHRSHGLGSAVIRYIDVNFARVLESAIPFFERNGFQGMGKFHMGQRYRTRVMVKASLIGLVGKLRGLLRADT